MQKSPPTTFKIGDTRRDRLAPRMAMEEETAKSRRNLLAQLQVNEASNRVEAPMVAANPFLPNQEEPPLQQLQQGPLCNEAEPATNERTWSQSPTTEEIVENEATIASLREENESLQMLLEASMQETRLIHQAIELHTQRALDRNNELMEQVQQWIRPENRGQQIDTMRQSATSTDQSNGRMVANVPEDVILSLLSTGAEYLDANAESAGTTRPVNNTQPARHHPRQRHRSQREMMAAQFASSLIQSSVSARNLAGGLGQSSRSSRNHIQGRASQQASQVQRTEVNDFDLNRAQEELNRLQTELNALKRKREG